MRYSHNGLHEKSRSEQERIHLEAHIKGTSLVITPYNATVGLTDKASSWERMRLHS